MAGRYRNFMDSPMAQEIRQAVAAETPAQRRARLDREALQAFYRHRSQGLRGDGQSLPPGPSEGGGPTGIGALDAIIGYLGDGADAMMNLHPKRNLERVERGFHQGGR